MPLLFTDALIRFHDAQLSGHSRWVALPALGALMSAIAANHHYNQQLWRTEDQARRSDVPDRYIVQCKRTIDRCNQCRNDAIECIDEELLRALTQVACRPGARRHSETVGTIIDRLSILSLKIFHMRAQVQRHAAGTDTNTDPAHFSLCRKKLHTLQRQRTELADCLAQLLAEIASGDTRFNRYHQFKMYNDPRLNPWLNSRTGVLPAESDNTQQR